MEEYEMLEIVFSKNVQALLTAEVKGKVNANVKDDELLIRIEFD